MAKHIRYRNIRNLIKQRIFNKNVEIRQHIEYKNNYKYIQELLNPLKNCQNFQSDFMYFL